MINDADAELLRRYADTGVEDAFAEFVRKRIGFVHAAALRRLGGDVHGAADVTQHVFIAAVRHARALTRHPGVIGWLYTTTRHAALDHMRNEQRRRQREHEAHAEDEITREGTSAVGSRNSAEDAQPNDWERMRPVLDSAMDELNASDREAVLMRFFEGRAFAEIGRRFQLTENSARMRVERALDKLHALLARRGVTSTAAAVGMALAGHAGAATAAVPAGLAGSVTGAALSSATIVTTAPLTGVLGFMSTAKIVMGIAVVLGVVGLGTAVIRHQEAAQLETTLLAANLERDTARTQFAAIGARVHEAERRAQASEQRADALEKEIARLSAAKITGVASATGVPAPTPNAGVNPFANPDYVKLSVDRYRRELGLKFGPLYRQLQLSPDQIEKFERNRGDLEHATQEVWSAAAAQGMSNRDPGVNKMAGRTAHQFEFELRDLLGETAYQAYADYHQTLSARDVATSLAGHLYSSSSPLNPQQGERLTEIVVKNTRSVPVKEGSRTTRRQTDWMAVAADARQVLAPDQAAALQALLDGKKIQEQMNALTRQTADSTITGASNRVVLPPAKKSQK